MAWRPRYNDGRTNPETKTRRREFPPARRTRCGQGRDRTGDLPLFRRTLVPTELPGHKTTGASGKHRMRRLSLATLTGLEPATSAVTGRRANQLRHRAVLFARERTLVDAVRRTQIGAHPTPSAQLSTQIHRSRPGAEFPFPPLHTHRARPRWVGPHCIRARPCARARTAASARVHGRSRIRGEPVSKCRKSRPPSLATGTSTRVPPTGFEPALPA